MLKWHNQNTNPTPEIHCRSFKGRSWILYQHNINLFLVTSDQSILEKTMSHCPYCPSIFFNCCRCKAKKFTLPYKCHQKKRIDSILESLTKNKDENLLTLELRSPLTVTKPLPKLDLLKRGLKAKVAGYLKLGEWYRIRLGLIPFFSTKSFQRYFTSNAT